MAEWLPQYGVSRAPFREVPVVLSLWICHATESSTRCHCSYLKPPVLIPPLTARSSAGTAPLADNIVSLIEA
jgi:hypothetical protein